MKVRKSNFELLRIIAIIYVICLHYMTKGGVIHGIYDDTSASNIAYNLVEQFAMVCCNIFILITGYFSVDSKLDIRKLIGIMAEVFFYSLIIPLVLGAFGIISLSGLTFSELTMLILPIEFEHYWYVTGYIGVFILSPILVSAVKNLPEKTLRTSIIGLLVIFCGFKSVNPYQIPWDRYGEDLPWFICVFLIGAYIKVYGIKIFDTFKKSISIYILATVGGFLIKIIASEIMIHTGKMWYYADMTTCNNYITILLASIALFYAFTYVDFSNSFINLLGAHTFGIYLLHNNILIEDKWQHWLGIDYAYGKWWQPIHMILSVVAVIIVGTFIDILRAQLFGIFTRKKNVKSN